MSDSVNLLNEISEVIKAKTHISHLYKSISEGMFHASKGFVVQSSSDITRDNNTWIRLVRLNKMSFQKWLRYKNDYDNTSRSRSSCQYLTMFNKNYERDSYNRQNDLTARDAFYMGVNIDSKIKISGYHYNICDIFNTNMFSSDNRSDTYDSRVNRSLSNFVYKLIYIGEKNYLIGFIDNKAILYVDNVLLTKILATSKDDFKKVVDRLISVYANANALFFSLNTIDFEREIGDKIMSYLFTKINNDSKDCTIIPPDHVDLFEDFSMVSTLVGKIRQEIYNQINNTLEGTSWGLNNQFSYKKLVDSLLLSRDENDKLKIQKAFMQGLTYGTKFETVGWTVSERDYDNTVCWEKDVNIVPVRAFYQRKMYNINADSDEWHNPFKITKLYVSGAGKMYCEGNHPNVSAGKVCMGDISGKIEMSDIKKLQANLARCEALLTSINYDSPYDGSTREDVLAHSVLQGEGNAEGDNEFIPDGTIIQDVVFEDDESSNSADRESPDDSTISINSENPSFEDVNSEVIDQPDPPEPVEIREDERIVEESINREATDRDVVIGMMPDQDVSPIISNDYSTSTVTSVSDSATDRYVTASSNQTISSMHNTGPVISDTNSEGPSHD